MSEESTSMLVHLTTDGVPKLHCPICDKVIFSLNGYVTHLKKHDPPGGFICRYCEARFRMEHELKRHRNELHTTIVCRLCKDITFSNEFEYREHIKIKHAGLDRELLKCPKCGAEYKSIEPYRRHIDTNCGTVKPFKCEICDMTFITKYNLKSHKEIHSGEPKYCCSYCGKNFVQKSRLIEHERCHTGEKPYKCDICGKCFAHRESIVTHSSIHTGVRLVECRNCHARFSCHSNLIKHRRARPQTCGRPEFDPPKQRQRNFASRIPATVNPTSEIRICNGNKIIKPDDRKQVRKTRIDYTLRSPKKRGRPKKYILDDEIPEELNIKNEPIIKKFNVQGAVDNEAFSINVIVENETECCEDINFEIHDSFPSPEISEGPDEADLNGIDPDIEFQSYTSETDNNITDTPIKEEHFEIELDDEPEEFLDNKDPFHNYSLKIEENVVTPNVEEIDEEILNDRESFVHDLINGENNVTEKPSKPIIKQEFDFLQQTEMVLFNENDSQANQELAPEDCDQFEEFTVEARDNCRILLDDITKEFPELKYSATVKVTRGRARTIRQSSSKVPSKQDSEMVNLNKLKVENDPISTSTTGSEDENKSIKHGEVEESPEEIINKIRKITRRTRISQRELKIRLNLLEKSKTYHCPYCVRVYHLRKPFEKHLIDCHQLPYEAVHEHFDDKKAIEALKDDVFQCPVCDKLYLIEKRLEDHVKRHGPEKNLIHKCPCHCKLYFATKEESIEHAKREHREKIYCEICDKYWIGVDSLKNHVRNFHSNKQPRNLKRNMVCDKCGKKFPGRTSLSDHVRSDCGKKPLYQCNVCGKHLTTAGILKTHLLLHSNETPFQCDICGKAFKVQAQYKKHLQTRHSNNKPFKCHLCTKEYPYRESLLTHMTVHTGIKRFLCNGCGKRFTCISNLQAHRKVHADTCGLLPLNAKATQYMGVQKGHLLLGSKPEAGLDYSETNTLIAKEVLDHDLPMAQDLNFPSEPSAPLATVPLSFKTSEIPDDKFEIPDMFTEYTDDDDESVDIYGSAI